MRRGSLAALLLAGTAGSAAFGQDAAGGLDSRATISERLEANSNYRLDDPSPGTSYFADTRLVARLPERDPRPRPSASASTPALRALWEAEQDFEFTLASPTGANLDYANEWANGRLRRRLRLPPAAGQRQLLRGHRHRRRPAARRPRASCRTTPASMRYDANVGCCSAPTRRRAYELRFIGNQYRLQRDRHQPDAALPRSRARAPGSCS